MASPANPFAALHQAQADGAASSTGRGRGSPFRGGTTFQPRGASAFQPRGGHTNANFRGRGRGRGTPAATRGGRGNARGAATTGNTWRANKADQQATTTPSTISPFAQLKHGQSSAPPATAPTPPSKPAFTGFGRGSSTQSGKPTNRGGTAGNARGGSRGGSSAEPTNGLAGSAVPVEDVSTIGSYNDRYEQLKIDRAKQREQAIKAGQMANPNQPMSLNKAITPVGTCTSMCPEFERVERIVQKMVDKSEKYLHPATNTLQNMEAKMLKRFRRSAAGYDEQLPSDIRTPGTLLQSMNYLTRHVIGGSEPLGIIHKFVWDRTRSIRNDFSVQQLTQEEDVKIAVTCLERIARFHIVSLHLLSSPANEEPFDRHQEREQLNNTMLSLMYYYDDNRGRILFPNEDEFRAYYIIFSIHDQRPDLEARVQKWPADLRNAPRVRVALELFAAAGNTWEYQGTLDAKRPNAIAQGFYARFFNLINSPGVSYLMACVAEIYFNHMRQTAIRSIWKGYCRYPASQQHKNEEWTVGELTNVLCFDDDEQTIQFCNEQDLEFAENANGDLYLNWGSRPVDSVAFQPSPDHSFSENYVESKRAGRNLVAVVLGLNIKEAAALGMIDRSYLSERGSAVAPTKEVAMDNDDSLFVSEEENEVPMPAPSSGAATPFGSIPQPATTGLQGSIPGFAPPFSQKPNDSQPQAQPPAASNPFASLFTPKDSASSPATSSSPSLNPFAKPFSPFPSSQTAETSPATATTSASAPSANNVQPSSAFSNLSSFAKPSSPFTSNQTAEAGQPTATSTPTSNGQSPSGFSNTSLFTQQNQNKEDSASSAAALFKLPTAFQPTTSQPQTSQTPPSLFENLQKPTTSATSPFSTPQSSSPFSIQPPQPGGPTAGQSSTSIFDLSKAPSAPTTQAPLFSFKPQEPATQKVQQSSFGTPQPQPPAAPTSPFSSPPVSEEKETSSIPPAPPTPRLSHLELPGTVPAVQPNADQSSASQAAILTNGEASNAMQLPQPIATQSMSSTEPEASHESVVDTYPDSDEPEASTTAVNQEQVSDEAKQAEAERKTAWLKWLREAAEKRRSTVSTPASRKRVHEQETPPSNKITKAPKVPKSEQPPWKSMAAASMKPLPKLPILEQIEAMTARKPTEQPAEPPKPNHVDEDDLLLSAARIAAESLRSGPRIMSTSSAPYEPWRPSLSPGSSIGSSAGAAFSRSLSPQQSLISGYDVSLAPDSDLGLGRSLSRTEQRIRMTGGKGLAYKPLDFTSTPQNSWSTPSKRKR
ncbi:putative leucine permease transcriptional regulator (SAC3) [Aspergillus undulatus]|uniref:putative leucine permease transcriptional regulator (SAC3) n=1 Tax=Aspergillus undulatus TaxID=1810928 RepID=UPI003CCCE922